MIYTIPNIYFIGIIAALTAYLTFLTTKGSLTDNRFSNVWEKLTRRGRIVLGILIAIGLTLILQDKNTQNLNSNQGKILKTERDKRDSLITSGIKSGVDLNNRRLFESLSEAFSNQGLKIDTLQNIITKIKNSNNNQNDPLLLIESNGINLKSKTNSTSTYEMVINCKDAGASNFKIKIESLAEYKNGDFIFSQPDILTYIKFPKDGKLISEFDIVGDLRNIYFRLKGKYSTLDNTKKYEMDNVYLYDCEKNLTYNLYNPERNKAISLINKYR